MKKILLTILSILALASMAVAGVIVPDRSIRVVVVDTSAGAGTNARILDSAILVPGSGLTFTVAGNTFTLLADTAGLPLEKYLPLAGGTMSNNAAIMMSGGTLQDVDTLVGQNGTNILVIQSGPQSTDGLIKIGGHAVNGGDTIVFFHREASVDWRTFTISTPKDSISAEGHKITMVADPDNDQDAATKKYVDGVALSGDTTAKVLYDPGTVSDSLKWGVDGTTTDTLTADGAGNVVLLRSPDTLDVRANKIGIPGGAQVVVNPDTLRPNETSGNFVFGTSGYPIGYEYLNQLYLRETTGTDSWLRVVQTDGAAGTVLTRGVGDSIYWGTGGAGQTDTLSSGAGNGTENFNMVRDSTGTRKEVRQLREGTNITLAYSGDTAVTITGAAGSGIDSAKIATIIRDTLNGAVGMNDKDIVNIERLDVDTIGAGTSVAMHVWPDSVIFDKPPFHAIKNADSQLATLGYVAAHAGGSGDDVRAYADSGTSPWNVPTPFWIQATTGIALNQVNGDTLELKFDSTSIVVTRALRADSSTGGATRATLAAMADSAKTIRVNTIDSTKITNGSVSSSDVRAMTSDSLARILSDETGGAGGFLRVSGTDSLIHLQFTDGTVDEADIAQASLDSTEIENGGVTSSDIKAMTSDSLARILSNEAGGAGGFLRVSGTDSLIHLQFTDGTVDEADVVQASLDSTEIENGGVTSSDIKAMTSDSLGRILSDEDGASGGFVRAGSTALQTDTLSSGAGDGAANFNMVRDSTGTRKEVRQLKEGTNVTLSYAGDTAVVITSSGGGETDTLSSGAGNGTDNFNMVRDSTGTRKEVRQLREGTNITLAYAGDTAVTITAGGGADNDTTKVLGDVGTGTPTALDKKVAWSGDSVLITDVSANAQALFLGSTTDKLAIRADSGLALGDTATDASATVLYADTLRAEATSTLLIGTAGVPVKRLYSNSVSTDTLLSVDSADITNFTDGTVDQNDLAANSVDSSKIVNGTVSSSDIKAMTSDSLARILSDETGGAGGFFRLSGTDSLIHLQFTDGTVDEADVVQASLDSTEIENGGVTSSDIKAMTSDSLARILSNEVGGTGGFLRVSGTDSLIHLQLTDGTVDEADVVQASLDSTEIENGGVTSSDIKAMTSDSLARILSNETGGTGGFLRVSGTDSLIHLQFTDGTVDEADVVQASLDSTEIENGGVTSSDIKAMTSDSLARILSDEDGASGGFVRAGSTTFLGLHGTADSSKKMDTTAANFTTYVTNHAGGALGLNAVVDSNINWPGHWRLPDRVLTRPKAATDSMIITHPIYYGDTNTFEAWDIQDSSYDASTVQLADTFYLIWIMQPNEDMIDSIKFELDTRLDASDTSIVRKVQLFSYTGNAYTPTVCDTTCTPNTIVSAANQTIQTNVPNYTTPDPYEKYTIRVVVGVTNNRRINMNFMAFFDD